MSRRPRLTTRKATANQRVFFDSCGVIDGHHANVCMGYWVGDAPPELMIRDYELAAGVVMEHG